MTDLSVVVTAGNSSGTATANATITVAAVTGGQIPMSFDDPMFTGMTERTTTVMLKTGQTLTRTSVQEQSGNPSVTCLGNNTLNYCRVNSRECIRITDNNVNINNCYLESLGVGNDHADTIQAYSPGARGGIITVTNTQIVAHTTAATAGYWTADGWGGTIKLDNVIFHGGPYGWRTACDPGCHIDMYLNNVYFVAPFGAAAYLIQDVGGGTHTIQQWNNVRNATIVNGVLVPGSLIPAPK